MTLALASGLLRSPDTVALVADSDETSRRLSCSTSGTCLRTADSGTWWWTALPRNNYYFKVSLLCRLKYAYIAAEAHHHKHHSFYVHCLVFVT